MSSNALSAYGTLLKRGNADGPPETFTTIAEIEQIQMSLRLGTVDISNMASPNNWMEKAPTMKEVASITANLAFVPTDATQSAAAGLLLDYKNRTLRNFKLYFSDAGPTVWGPIAAYVTDFNLTGKHDDVYRATVTLTPTGDPGLA